MKYLSCLAFVLFLFSTSNSQTPAGNWHVVINGNRASLSFAQQGERYVGYLGTPGTSCNERLDSVSWDGNRLEFKRNVGGYAQWYRVEIGDGVMIGRFASGGKSVKPDLSAYRYHITGWNEFAFPITPAVFDINANGYRARVRIDKQGDTFTGRLKFYAYQNSVRENPEEDISVTRWDGEGIEFKWRGQVYKGETDGATISGTFTHCGLAYPWSGRRAEVLTYGLAGKSGEERTEWQARTRRILYRLMMAGNPQPLSMNVEILREGIPPIAATPYPLRDDKPNLHPQNYTLTELRLTFTLPNWLGGAPIRRVVHGYLSKPNTPGPYPLVLALNGHAGSAYHTFNPAAQYCWYGDSFARRGYMVLSVDIGHRPGSDVISFGSSSDPSTFLGYKSAEHSGDDPANGNGPHPSIKAEGMDSDWEEDGERVWDALGALDYAVSRSDVAPGKIVVTGLSMGGEVATYVGALDERVAVSIPAGFSPDLNVLKFLGSHGCWNWSFADIREYIDQSDLLALTAPRPLILQTGKLDALPSSFPQPFAGSKQIVRRARTAYDLPTLLHFLHEQGHEYQTDLRWTVITEPLTPGDLSWQTNGETVGDGRDLFEWLSSYH